jgi:hypothetical protein
MGLVVCVTSLCIGFLVGGLNLPTWALLGIAFTFAWLSGPVLVRGLSRRHDKKP